MTARNITNDNIYELIDKSRLEQKSDMQILANALTKELSDLRRQFETLEAGRLTRLESRMNDFVVGQANRDATIKQNQAVLSTKFLVVGFIAVAIFNALLYGIFTRVFTK